MALRYYATDNEVRLGDQVELRVLFRRREGRVVYVPGVSPLNPEFEYNGMRWVGIRLSDRSLVATPVLHKLNELKKKVRFVRRDESPCDFITPSSREFEEHGEGPSF